MRHVLPLLLVAGCFQDSYTVDDYWRELANAHCSAMQYCCTRAEYNDWWSEDDGTTYSCRAAHGEPIFAEDIREGIRRGRIDFDPELARSCIIALETIACTDFQPAIRYRETYCEPPLRGTIPDSGSCGIDEECESGHCVSGRCVRAVGQGEPCSLGECADGLRCQANGLCDYGLSAGASCRTDDECAADWCKDPGLFTDGTCVRACDGI